MPKSPAEARRPVEQVERTGNRREVLAWAMYDWANSAYSALSITILVYYIKSVVAPGDLGTIIWSWGIGLSMLLAAVLSPVVGAIADAHASKRRWLAATALPGAACAALLSVIPPENTWLVVALFFCACLGFELSLGLYNGFLPEIADQHSINRVSAFGYATGYVGGGIALAIAVAVLGYGDSFGLPGGTALTKDWNATRDGRFAVAVPNGSYRVTVTLGDAAAARDQMEISLQGNVVDNVTTAAGEHVERIFTTSVDDGQLLVGLVDRGGDDPLVAVNALSVVDAADGVTVAALDFGTPGSDCAAGHTWVTAADEFRTWDLDAGKRYLPQPISIKKKREQLDERRLATQFGWQSGQIAGHDVVTPVRLRIGLLIMGLWWGVFSIPALVVLRDRGTPRHGRKMILRAARDGVVEVFGTLRHVRRFRTLALFLLAFLIYNDGIQTVITQASVFAIEALKMPADELIMVVLMIQFLALPGAWAVGRLADHFGQKRMLLACLSVWVGLLIAAYFVQTSLQFWIMGGVLAMVMGGSQSVSRAVMGAMTPAAHTAEFFGFFNFSGKATSMLGPILFGSILVTTGSPHSAILSLLGFFVVGWLLISRLDFVRGRQEALAAEADV